MKPLEKMWLSAFFLSLFSLLTVSVFSFEAGISLDAKQQKCFGEELGKDALAEIAVAIRNTTDTSGVIVPAPSDLEVTVKNKQNVVFKAKGKASVKSAFAAEKSGTHWVCIKNTGDVKQKVDMKLLAGTSARDYSAVAKKEHLGDMELNLLEINDAVFQYHKNVMEMRSGEERMREINDGTSNRIIGFCLFNVFLMVGVGGYTMFYFRSFFKAKKII